MHLDQPLGNGKPQPQAAELPGRGAPALLERVKYPVRVLRFNADPGIAHLDDHMLVLTLAAQPYVAALRGELDCIGEEVPDHLLKPRGVSIDAMRAIFQFDPELQPPRVDVG